VNKYITNIALIIASAALIKRILKRRKKVIVSGSYSVPRNLLNRLDALHSFESRKSDGFGGKMSTKINAALRELYNKGMNPDIKKLNILIDPVLFKVTWSAELGESSNGIPYVGLITRGSAGSGADERALQQLPKIKEAGQNVTLVKDLNFTKGVKIRQFFYKYSLPEYPSK
jgi:hypothetical protein